MFTKPSNHVIGNVDTFHFGLWGVAFPRKYKEFVGASLPNISINNTHKPPPLKLIR